MINISLEITVRNLDTKEEETIDLMNDLETVKEMLVNLVTDEQIENELDLDKPDISDYDNKEEYQEAIEEFEEALEDELDNYKDDIEFSDLDNFLEIVSESGSLNTDCKDLEDIENLVGEMEEISSTDDWRAILAIYNNVASNLTQAIEIFNSGDFYWFADMDMEDVVDYQIDNGIWGEIPSNIRNYLDLEAMARDLSHDGYSYDDEANGVIAVY